MQINKLKKEHIPIIIKILVLLFALLSVFFHDLVIIFADALESNVTSYVLIIPFIFGYLIFRKRKILGAVISEENKPLTKETKHLPTIAGILLFLTALFLYWYGSYTFTPVEIHILALPIFVAGLILIIFNPQTLRQLMFPLVFLFFLVPLPSEFFFGLGSSLSIISAEMSFAIINGFGIPTTLSNLYGNPTIYITRPNNVTIPFAVDATCSGIHSLFGFLIFGLFIAYISRDKISKKLLLFVVGIPLIYGLNIIRITTILFIGYQFGEELALQIFHMLGGWILIFSGTLLILVISDKIFKMNLFSKTVIDCSKCKLGIEKNQKFCLKCGRILRLKSLSLSKKDAVKLVAVTLSAFFIISFQAPVFAMTQGPAVLEINTPSGQQISTNILPDISDYQLDFLYRDYEFEQVAHQDMSLVYQYFPINNSSNKLITTTIEISSSRSNLHRWETCLNVWTPEHIVEQIEKEDVLLIDNPPISGRYFIFRYIGTNNLRVILYWFETSSFSVNSTSQQKHVKISLMADAYKLDDVVSIKNQLMINAKQIVNYWKPIKSFSGLMLLLSLNVDKLGLLTIGLIAGVVGYYFLIKKLEQRKNSKVYNKFSESIRQLFEIIYETEKTGNPTLDNIFIVYQKTSGESVDKQTLLNELAIIEKTVLVKKSIVNKNDQPIIVWKTQINPK
jgi:exosortase